MKRRGCVETCCAGMLAVLCAGFATAVHAAAHIADVDDTGLPAGTYWNGSDLSGAFYSHRVHFRNRYDTNYFSWSGFSASSVSDTNTVGWSNQYAVWTPGTDVSGTGTYAVAYDSAWDEQDIVRFPFPVCVKGFYVNNTTYAALSMRHGDGYAKAFGGASGDDPDWFKLVVTGKDETGTGLGNVEFYLADYRFTNNVDDYIVGEWTWLDLTSLGNSVKTLHFALSSSDNDPLYGMKTPAYFALDELGFVPQPGYLAADLEDAGMSPNTYRNGSDGLGGYYDEVVHFRNDYDITYGSWAGFALSTVNDTNTPGWGNQYAVWSPGTGLGGTGTYAVAYDSAWNEQDIVTFPYRALVKGLYVNNTTYAALSMLNGDGYAKQFGGATGEDPDWFKLVVTGKDASGVSQGDVEFYLADYRFTNGVDDYIVSEWTWIDLTSLGPAVKSLHFSLSSSDNDPLYGMKTPAYVAVDGMEYAYTFSSHEADTNLYDAAVPGFVGAAGAGSTNAPNVVNPAFAGWAAQVTDYNPASDVTADWTNASRTLGPVTGDLTDIASLGELSQEQIDGGAAPGSITLRMALPIADKQGPDFAVFENGMGITGTNRVGGEVGYVEISSDGTNFTRFPTACLWTNAVDMYEGFDPRFYDGMCGKHANAYGLSWGTPFDLSDLACHADVQSGTLSLTNVNYVRVVDIPGNGSFYDTLTPSNSVYDQWPTFGSGGMDIEAVGVLNAPGFARIETHIVGPGDVSPRGWPNGAVAVPFGSNAAFSITARTGYHLVDVKVNGESRGPLSSCTFTNVRSDQTLTAHFGSRLVIHTPHGVSNPTTGTNYGYGPVAVTLSGTPETLGGTQHVCAGWVGTGSVPPAGTGVAASFSLTNDSSLTWLWNTNYRLNVGALGRGTVDREDAWHPAGTSVTSTAAADPYYEFAGWSGDVNGDTNALSMVVDMDRARTLVARFWAESATNGVPLAWLTAHGLTNKTPDQAAMSDRWGKGMLAWQEFYAGTDPNDPASLFEVTAFGSVGASNYVTWTGGTNGSTLPFAVMGKQKLTGAWNLLDGEVSRGSSGTNVWWCSGDSNRFYRIEVHAP